jgi:DNA repair exonuclease SbcCD ATPase subunit
MIPLRVYLKNFLCHADREFLFDGHPVWLLHGPNGVGKSAVFDAMLYALYAESRRGDARKNAVVDVIRHGENSMRVEFDFEVSGRRYQVWRTRARSGQPKQGVNQWTNGTWSPIRDVNSARELDEWVTRTLGLTYETFVSAVLLRQGAAEKLIDAEKGDRRELFRSFIDLDPFIQLHERVTAARADVSADVRQFRARLAAMPAINDDQVTTATTAAQIAEQVWQTAKTAESASRDRLGHARTWEQHEASRRRIQGELDAAADRSRRAAELERQVGRLRELRVLVPALVKIDELQGVLAAAEETAKLRSAEHATAIMQNNELNGAIAQLRTQIVQLREQVADLDRQIVAQDAEQNRLSAEIGRSEQAATLHENLRLLKDKTFDQDLDSRLDAAERAATQAQSIKDALPFLQPLVTHRGNYRQAVADEGTAIENVNAAWAEVERLRRAKMLANEELNNATTRKGEADQAAAVAKDQHEKATERCNRFATTATKPVCSECGQPINVSHVAKERAKLEKAVDSAKTNLQACRTAVTTASGEATAALEHHRQLDTDCRTAEQRHGDAVRARNDASSRAVTARTAFENGLSSLDESFASRVIAIADDGFPTTDDIVAMRAIAKELPARTRSRDALLQKQRDREQTKRDIQVLEQSVAAVGAPADVSKTRIDLANIETVLTGLREQRAKADEARAAAEESESQLLIQQQELGVQIAQFSGDAAAARADVTSSKKQLKTAIALVPESHRGTATAITAQQLQALTNERDGLQGGGAEEEFAALADDRALQAERERQLSQLERQINQLPADARRSAAEVEQEVSDAEAATKNAEQLHDHARSQLRSITGQRDQRKETEGQLSEAERSHALHDRLAELLGSEYIQLDLVRGAESRIIARADEILGRLSTGELRFEPPDPESSRAFDLSVRRRDCPEPIAVGNLSGGQRFRVAVSLALAVCQGAGDAAKPLESVIIDEGFGALDRDGRMAMITELRDGQTLTRMFKRVLVVSHQDDFASAFPVGYRLHSEGGITTVEPFGICTDEH